ncbi:MAG: hypothetical protein CAPSK01_001429 [Candidatus Accumulibacter vicinus]|uniref:Uncharacterized protein n=1 Tax=Candidatus Accumulibacter vicinus TaxID=2954382 RepID=A0A084Y1I2_9PROT|nr:MAG: hypothetical protein CAPSK01_001429 [Candidatus Accumulibacter vicinus]
MSKLSSQKKPLEETEAIPHRRRSTNSISASPGRCGMEMAMRKGLKQDQRPLPVVRRLNRKEFRDD